MNRLATALRAELFIARYSLGARLVVLAPLLLACAQLLIAALGDASTATQQTLIGEETVATNGYGNWVDSLVTGFTALGLLITGYSAHSFAADRELGALRHRLIRLSSRTQIVIVKLLLLHLLALASLLLLILGSWLLSTALWELGPVIEDAVFPLPAAIAFGVLLSVVAQSAMQSLSLALGLTLAFDVFKTSLGDMAGYVYARFQPSLIDASYLGDVARLARGYSDVLIDERLLVLNLWSPLPAFLLCLGLSLFVVRTKNL
jgi:ABC-type transport system involved in multi-copper enzyme maturation permease subunit